AASARPASDHSGAARPAGPQPRDGLQRAPQSRRSVAAGGLRGSVPAAPPPARPVAESRAPHAPRPLALPLRRPDPRGPPVPAPAMTGAVARPAQRDATAIRTKRTKPADTVLAIGASARETSGTPAWVPEPDQRLSRRAP